MTLLSCMPTYPLLEWNPHDAMFAEEEAKCMDKEGYAQKFGGKQQHSSVMFVEDDFVRRINKLTAQVELVTTELEKANAVCVPLHVNWVTQIELPTIFMELDQVISR
jgi:hypothetical protein